MRLLYNDFSAFSRDQELLISTNGRMGNDGFDYVEGFLLMQQGLVDLSFYPTADQQRITSLLNQYGILYTIELAKYYDDTTKKTIDKVHHHYHHFFFKINFILSITVFLILCFRFGD